MTSFKLKMLMMLTFTPALRRLRPVRLLHSHPAALEEKQLSQRFPLLIRLSQLKLCRLKCLSKHTSVDAALLLGLTDFWAYIPALLRNSPYCPRLLGGPADTNNGI